MKVAVLVFSCCCHNLSQTWWDKTTQCTVVEVRRPAQASLAATAPGVNQLSASLFYLETTGGS